MTATTIDPRPLYLDAVSWTADRIARVTPEQLTLPTPCTEFTVADLLGHLVATVRRALVIGEGGDPLSVPVVVTGLSDPAGEYSAAAAGAVEIWSDATRLDALVTVPWGKVPGRAALFGYLNETLVHGWDLAVATGQDFEADPSIATPLLEIVAAVLPSSPRGGHVPFDDVVEPRPAAGPTERVANWSGRISSGWVGA